MSQSQMIKHHPKMESGFVLDVTAISMVILTAIVQKNSTCIREKLKKGPEGWSTANQSAMLTFRPRNLYFRRKRSGLFRIAFAALWIGLNAYAIIPSRADSIPQLVAKTKPATVQILALDENWSPIKSGTWFFVSADGLD
jgi:hypothetical protein